MVKNVKLNYVNYKFKMFKGGGFMTVEEIATELGVSKQTIYKKIKNPSFKDFLYYENGVKKISEEGVNILKGRNPNDEIIERQLKEIKELKEEKKALLNTVNQQNQIILEQNQIIINSQQLEKQAMENTKAALTSVEKMLLEKREELDKRKVHFENKSIKRSFFKRFFLKFSPQGLV